MASRISIGKLNNHGHISIDKAHSIQIGHTFKRARASDSKITCYVIDPNRQEHPVCVVIASTGKGRAPSALTHVEEFDANDNPLFWQLWARYDGKMLHQGDKVPITDLKLPLASMAKRTFYLCDWTPEYEAVRAELGVLKYTYILDKIEKEEEDAKLKLSQVQERKSKCIELLEKYKQNQH